MSNSPLFFAFVACLGFGFAGPTMKMALKMGANANAIILCSGMGILLGCGINLLRSDFLVFGSANSMAFSILTGLLTGAAYISMFEAFKIVTVSGSGLITAVLAITAIYPLVTALVEIGFMEIPKGINLKLIIPGAILILGGGILVSIGMNK